MKKMVLDLPLMGKWYEMTASGVKKEEYREIKPYWIRLMFNEQIAISDEYIAIKPAVAQFFTNFQHVLKYKLKHGRLKFKYTHVRIRLGYTKETLQREVESVRIGKADLNGEHPTKM